MAKVIVRPIDTNRWHGKKGKESFTKPKVIEVLYDHETGGYATGLTAEEVEAYGKKMGVDLSSTFNPTEPHPYWSTKAASIKLENSTVIFDTDKAAEFVKVKNMKASKFVANSMKEYDEGIWPEATHVIYDEESEMEEKASKVSIRQKCYGFLDKLSNEDKANVIQVLAGRTVKGKSTNFLDGEIGELIENQPEEFLRYMQLGKAEVEIRAKVLELLARNILVKDGGIRFMGDVIAADDEDAIRWFKSPENSKMKAVILERLNNIA